MSPCFHLNNHKSSVKLQLMRYLGCLSFPKALQLQYHGYPIEPQQRNVTNLNNLTASPLPAAPKKNLKE